MFMYFMECSPQKGTSSMQPIPSDVKLLTTDAPKLPKKLAMDIHNLDDDKITEDTVEMRTPELPTKHSEWVNCVLFDSLLL